MKGLAALAAGSFYLKKENIYVCPIRFSGRLRTKFENGELSPLLQGDVGILEEDKEEVMSL